MAEPENLDPLNVLKICCCGHAGQKHQNLTSCTLCACPGYVGVGSPLALRAMAIQQELRQIHKLTIHLGPGTNVTIVKPGEET